MNDHGARYDCDWKLFDAVPVALRLIHSIISLQIQIKHANAYFWTPGRVKDGIRGCSGNKEQKEPSRRCFTRPLRNGHQMTFEYKIEWK